MTNSSWVVKTNLSEFTKESDKASLFLYHPNNSKSVKHMFPTTTRLSTFPLFLHEYSIVNFKVLGINDCEISYQRDNFKTRIPGKILGLTLTGLRVILLFSF